MDERNIIVGLDIGTSKVCTAIALLQKGLDPEVIGIGIQQNFGLKKGLVVDIERTVHSIKESVKEAEFMAGVKVKKAVIGIAGEHISNFYSSGVIGIKGKEVDKQDLVEVLNASKIVVLPNDKRILHVIPQEYCVDNIRHIKDPVGMSGTRLEVKVQIITGSVSLIQNIVRCVEKTGISVDEIVLRSMASSRAILYPEEKEMGIILIDIGEEMTDIAIWKNAYLLHSQLIPIGGNHFTNDLSIVLKIPAHEAEKIKMNSGGVLQQSFDENDYIELQKILGMRFNHINPGVIQQVLEARAEELFKIIKSMISAKFLENNIVGGVVLTGGGALIKGLPALGEYIIEVPTRIGFPDSFRGMTGVVKGPKFSTVFRSHLTIKANEG